MKYFMGLKRNWKNIIKLSSFIVIAILLNYLLQFVFNVDRQLYRFQNHDFNIHNGDFDYVAFGPSDCLNTFDTQTIESKYHKTAFNFGGTGTSYKHIIRYLFDSKIEDIPSCSTVIFFVPYYEISNSDETPKEAYYQYLNADPSTKIKMFFSSSMTAAALERACPWQELFVTPHDSSITKSLIHITKEGLHNIANKFSSKYRLFDLCIINKPDSYHYYRGNGFSTIEATDEIISDDLYNSLIEDYTYTNTTIDEDKLSVQAIEYVIGECIRKDICPVVVMGPMRIDYILQKSNYFTYSNELKKIAEQSGALYVDMNLIRKEIFHIDVETHWHNQSHFNATGAREYTIALYDAIEKLKNNECTYEDLFYTDPNEYILSLQK